MKITVIVAYFLLYNCSYLKIKYGCKRNYFNGVKNKLLYYIKSMDLI